MKRLILFYLVLILSCNVASDQTAKTQVYSVPKGFDVVKYYKNKGVSIEIENGMYGIMINKNSNLKDEDCRYFSVINKLSYFILRGRGNNLSDTCLQYLTNTENVEFIDISDANITDKGLSCFKNTQHLNELHLKNINISDEGMSYFKNNKDIKILTLTYLKITDISLSYMINFHNLKEIDLSCTHIKGDGLIYLKDIPRLQVISLIQSKVTDDGLKSVCYLKSPNLFIDLGSTDITDKGLKHLETNTNLLSLMVGHTKTTAKGREELQKKLPSTNISVLSAEGGM